MKKKVLLFIFFIVSILVVSSVNNALSKDFLEEEQLIRVGAGAYKDGFYDVAEQQFSYFIRHYSAHEKVYDICYLLGKTLLVNGKLNEAKAVFLKILNESKQFEYIDYTLFWLAEINLRLAHRDESRKYLASLI